MKLIANLFAVFTLLFMTSPASASDTPKRLSYPSFDGQVISYQQLGEGPTVLLLHGFMSSGQQNYIMTGIGQKIAAAGYTVIIPDLRGHGQSQVKDDPLSWPADAAARDQLALIRHLGTEPYAVAGYSYGSLTALRFHLLSRKGGRLILGGVGESAADDQNTDRNDGFRAALAMAEDGADNDATTRIKFQMKATGGTLPGYRGALSSRLYTGADLLKTFDIPVLVLTGDQDFDNGSGSGPCQGYSGRAPPKLERKPCNGRDRPGIPCKNNCFFESELNGRRSHRIYSRGKGHTRRSLKYGCALNHVHGC